MIRILRRPSNGSRRAIAQSHVDIRTRIGAIIPIAAAAVVGSYQSTEYRRVDADLLAKAASSAHASTAMSMEKISERQVEKTLPIVEPRAEYKQDGILRFGVHLAKFLGAHEQMQIPGGGIVNVMGIQELYGTFV